MRRAARTKSRRQDSRSRPRQGPRAMPPASAADSAAALHAVGHRLPDALPLHEMMRTWPRPRKVVLLTVAIPRPSTKLHGNVEEIFPPPSSTVFLAPQNGDARAKNRARLCESVHP